MVDLTNGDDAAPKEKASMCFPLEPFTIFGGACCCLPPTWKKIQDCTHLILVLGVICSICMVLLSAIHIYNNINKCGQWENEYFCGPQISGLIFGVLLSTYVSGIISQWDEQLMAKEELCKQQKQKLLNSYNELLSDMDGLLTNATESASGLAERSFESKRRDFQRFLERAKSRFSTGFRGDVEMLQQFRRFCVNWLNVFKECSIDPVGKPTEVVTQEELERHSTIEEVADLCLERLRVTEVRFISAQRDKDRQNLDSQQKNFRRHTIKQAPRLLAIEAGGGNHSNTSNQSAIDELKEKSAVKKSRTTWLRCGGGGKCKCDAYPTECTGGFFSVQCLSKQHSTLLFVFFLGLTVITEQVIKAIGIAQAGVESEPLDVMILVLMFFAMVCTIVVLLNFEDIDTVQRLEREVSELKEQNKAVGEQREKMKAFWTNAQNLTELWLYRTVPRLDLYKELHSQLEDENEEDLLTHIAGANHCLESLEDSLGELKTWRNDGALKLEDKKLFGKTVNELCQIGQFGEMLMQLEDTVLRGPVMRKLKAM